MLKALAHAVRFKIMRLLADKSECGIEEPGCCDGREVCVCRLHESFDISAPTLSHHLKLLREAGLIEGRRDGVWVYYASRPEPQAILDNALARLRPSG